MNKAILGIIIAVIVIGGGAWLFMKHNSSSMQPEQMPMPTQQQAQQQTQQLQVTPTTAMQQSAGQLAVTIKNYAFSPATLTVKVGDKVTWTNEDSAPHSATADDGSFDTGVLQNGQSGSVMFNKPGTYTYHCSVHPMMKATIVVQ